MANGENVGDLLDQQDEWRKTLEAFEDDSRETLQRHTAYAVKLQDQLVKGAATLTSLPSSSGSDPDLAFEHLVKSSDEFDEMNLGDVEAHVRQLKAAFNELNLYISSQLQELEGKGGFNIIAGVDIEETAREKTIGKNEDEELVEDAQEEAEDVRISEEPMKLDAGIVSASAIAPGTSAPDLGTGNPAAVAPSVPDLGAGNNADSSVPEPAKSLKCVFPTSAQKIFSIMLNGAKVFDKDFPLKLNAKKTQSTFDVVANPDPADASRRHVATFAPSALSCLEGATNCFLSFEASVSSVLPSPKPADSAVRSLFEQLAKGGKIVLELPDWVARGIAKELGSETSVNPTAMKHFDNVLKYVEVMKKNVKVERDQSEEDLVEALSCSAALDFIQGPIPSVKTVLVLHGTISVDLCEVDEGQMFKIEGRSKSSTCGSAYGTMTEAQAQKFNNQGLLEFNVDTQEYPDFKPLKTNDLFPYRVVPLFNEVPTQRCLKALGKIEELMKHPETKFPFHAVITGQPPPRGDIVLDETVEEEIRGAGFDPSQRKAVREVLGTFKNLPLQFLRGPPGTGKTTTISRLVKMLLASSSPLAEELRPVMICAPTNQAVKVVEQKLRKEIRTQVDQPLNMRFHDRTKGPAVSPFNIVRVTNLQDNAVYTAQLIAALKRGDEAAIKRNCSTLPAFAYLVAKHLQKYGKSEELRDKCATYIELLPNADTLCGDALDEFKRIERKVNEEAFRRIDAVLATSSHVGSNRFPRSQWPKFILMDEAAKETEPGAMISAAKFPCANLYLDVGDEQQGNPYSTKDLGQLELSRFKRLVQCGWAVSEFQLQYRMHNDICELISGMFYGNRLSTAAAVRTRPLDAWMRGWASQVFPGSKRNNLLLDVGSRERQVDNSFDNAVEADTVAWLLGTLLTAKVNGESLPAATVAVIGMYKPQIKMIRDKLKKEFGAKADRMKVITVDSSQGDEADLVIISLVRSNNRRVVGYVDQSGRLNVGFSRGKSMQIAVANRTFFMGYQPPDFILDKANRVLFDLLRHKFTFEVVRR